MQTKWVVVGGVAVVAILGAAGWIGRDVYAEARIGTAYVAKQTCSCLFVAHRLMESCKTDYDSAAVKPLTWQTAADSVTVSALSGLVSAKAVFEDGFGCHPVN
jgi:hypothetical protein